MDPAVEEASVGDEVKAGYVREELRRVLLGAPGARRGIEHLVLAGRHDGSRCAGHGQDGPITRTHHGRIPVTGRQSETDSYRSVCQLNS